MQLVVVAREGQCVEWPALLEYIGRLQGRGAYVDKHRNIGECPADTIVVSCHHPDPHDRVPPPLRCGGFDPLHQISADVLHRRALAGCPLHRHRRPLHRRDGEPALVQEARVTSFPVTQAQHPPTDREDIEIGDKPRVGVASEHTRMLPVPGIPPSGVVHSSAQPSSLSTKGRERSECSRCQLTKAAVRPDAVRWARTDASRVSSQRPVK